MPSKTDTPVRRRRPRGDVQAAPHTIRCPEPIWQAAMARASREGKTLSSVIVAMLEDYGDA